MWHDGLSPFFSWWEVILSEKPFWAYLFVIACQLFIFPLWTILSEFTKDWSPMGNCGSTITSQWSPRLRWEWRLSTAPWQAQPFPAVHEGVQFSPTLLSGLPQSLRDISKDIMISPVSNRWRNGDSLYTGFSMPKWWLFDFNFNIVHKNLSPHNVKCWSP